MNGTAWKDVEWVAESGPPRLGAGVHLYPCYLSTHAILSIRRRGGEEERMGWLCRSIRNMDGLIDYDPWELHMGQSEGLPSLCRIVLQILIYNN